MPYPSGFQSQHLQQVRYRSALANAPGSDLHPSYDFPNSEDVSQIASIPLDKNRFCMKKWTVLPHDSLGARAYIAEDPCFNPFSETHHWENPVLWSRALYDEPLVWVDPLTERYTHAPSFKALARRVRYRVSSKIHEGDKAHELIKGGEEWQQDFHWRRSLILLITHTKIKDETPKAEVPQSQTRQCVWNRYKQRITQIHADRIPQPDLWSITQFEDYVRDLVTSSVTGTLHSQLYDPEDSHTLTVGRLLHDIFGNRLLDAYWSISACNMALSFFYKNSQFREARSFFSRMEDRDLLTSPDTFNIVLRASVKRKDITHFKYIMEQMVKRGVKPNTGTWEAFFMIDASNWARSMVYQSMRDNHIFHESSAMRNFLKLTIRDVLAKQLQEGKTIIQFLEYMDRLRAFSWLSTVVGNIILDEIGDRGPVQDIIKVLDQLEIRGMRFDETTLNIILHHCLPNRDHDVAIRTITQFRTRYSLLPGKLAYDLLFRQVWRSHLYNCSKVIWRYACVEGMVTHRMKRSVANSLLSDPPSVVIDESTTRGTVWKEAAGKVVVGVGLARTHFERFRSYISLTKPYESQESSLSAVHGANKHTEDIWNGLFSEDLSVAHCLHIKDNLDNLLRKALAMDCQWALEDVHRQKSIHWIQRNSIPVALKENFPARFLPMHHPGRDWDRYLKEKHPSLYQGNEDSLCDYRILELDVHRTE